MLRWSPLKKSKKLQVSSRKSSSMPATSVADGIAFGIAFRFRSGAGAGARGVGGCELGALQSKSWHVPTRRQMKHQRVRQVSW